MLEYIYLDTLERKRFAKSAHEYLIETVQQFSIVDTTDIDQLLTLDFDGPSKEIIWIVQKSSYVAGTYNQNKLTFNYSLNANGVGNPVDDIGLSLNGYSRFLTGIHNMFYNYLQPFKHHTRCPGDGINVYSFALFPEEHQPSCSCNFSRIGSTTFKMSLNPLIFKYYSSDINPSIIPMSEQDAQLSTTVDVRAYSKRYNVLRIIGGMAGFGYKYTV